MELESLKERMAMDGTNIIGGGENEGRRLALGPFGKEREMSLR